MGATFCSSLSVYSWMVSSISRPLLEISESWPSTAFLQPNVMKWVLVWCSTNLKFEGQWCRWCQELQHILSPKISPKPKPSLVDLCQLMPTDACHLADLAFCTRLWPWYSSWGPGCPIPQIPQGQRWTPAAHGRRCAAQRSPETFRKRLASRYRIVETDHWNIGISFECHWNMVKVEMVEMIITTTWSHANRLKVQKQPPDR